MIPAGLDHSIEIYKDGENCRVLINGNRMDYLELPIQLREPIQATLFADKAAFDFIMNKFKITDNDKIEECFAKCRFGTLDSEPDIVGNNTVSDCPCCPNIATCEGYNIVCKSPQVINGHITRNELRVICLVANGRQNGEIAESMSIELNTVLTYLSRIREKLCINNRIEIALWAYKKGIIASPR